MKQNSRLIVDGHVHIYPNYDVDKFFQAALYNMARCNAEIYPGEEQAYKILLLSESRENDFFSRLKNGEIELNKSNYRINKTKEAVSLVLSDNDKPLCYILKGRQIVTQEKLEVLALASDLHIPDGLPIKDVIKKIIARKDIAVLAWGVGKWWFKRGKIIEQVIGEIKSPYLFMGDNSARPGFWPGPKLFRLAEKANMFIINGSDPLPFADEVFKVGSYGFSIEGEFAAAEPAGYFKNALLANPGSIRFFGSRDSAVSFFKRQARMFLKKHF